MLFPFLLPFSITLNVNFAFDLKDFLNRYHTCLSKELCDWCKFSFLLQDFVGGIHIFSTCSTVSTLPGALSWQDPTLSVVDWALVTIDLPYTRVLLPAEKAGLAQLDKCAREATFALCSEDLAPAYAALVR